jgi:hypothetical protein
MRNRELFPSLFGFTLIILLVFGILRWLSIPTGDLLDWVIGIGSFWWLMFITTIPWDTHFKAKEVLAEAANYRLKDKKQSLNEEDLRYARRISNTYLITAISLHLVSSVGLYLVAYYEISLVGYWGAALAVLLTALRPAMRLYAYIHYRLSMISNQMQYPKQDVYLLESKVQEMQAALAAIEQTLNPDHPHSWRSQTRELLAQNQEQIYQLKKEMQDFRLKQESEMQQVQQKNEQKIAQISEDAQLLSQVRELVRFIKNA